MAEPDRDQDPEGFVREHTELGAPSLVAEVRLRLSADAYLLWARTEDAAGLQRPPPFWAFAWPGGQALARYLLDEPGTVAGRRVLDVASGSGLVALAAARAGAARVTAADIDPLAVAAIGLNAAANGVEVDVRADDLLDGDGDDAEVVLVGDAFYERELAERVLGLLQRAAARGAAVLAGDLGRAYLPRAALDPVAVHDVPVNAGLEGEDVKRTTVWRLRHP